MSSQLKISNKNLWHEQAGFHYFKGKQPTNLMVNRFQKCYFMTSIKSGMRCAHVRFILIDYFNLPHSSIQHT